MPYAANKMCGKEHILWFHSHEFQAQKDNSMVIGVGKEWAGELPGVLEIWMVGLHISTYVKNQYTIHLRCVPSLYVSYHSMQK